MAEEQEPEIPIQPEDPQYEPEEHLKFRRKQEVTQTFLARLIQQNLTSFRQIMDGSAHAYTKLKIRNAGLKQLTDSIKNYQHLRIIDLSFNILKDVSHLLSLNYVISLDLSRNLINNASFLSRDVLPYLRDIDLQGNKIQNVPVILVRNLRRINLNNNLISTAQDFEGHPLIQVIYLRGNRLTNLKGIQNLPSLKELYIAQNQLTGLNQLSKVQNLTRIHARKNKISAFETFPELPKLQYLNLRQNQITKVTDLAAISPSVKVLNLLANPIQAQLGENTKKQVWMRFRNYTKINKNQVTAEERQEFDKEYKDRLAEQERERLEKEREAAQLAEQTKQPQNQNQN